MADIEPAKRLSSEAEKGNNKSVLNLHHLHFERLSTDFQYQSLCPTIDPNRYQFLWSDD